MKKTFKVKKDGQEVEFAVVQPKPADGRQAQIVHDKTFAEALRNDALFRDKLEDFMRKQGLWNDEKEKQHLDLVKSLHDKEYTLKKGGIRAVEAKQIAIDMRRKRLELRDLISERNSLDSSTAEGQAENARFNCLVSLCLVNNETGEKIYKDIDDYLEHSTDEEAYEGARTLAEMLYNLDKDFEKQLPENKFLVDYGFADNELRLVDKDGNFVDTEGRKINKDGQYIDEEGNVVDYNGRPINSDGEYEVEFQPFLDDDGSEINPINSPAQKKRGRPKKEE